MTNLNIFDEENPFIIRVVFGSKSLVWSEGLLSSSQNVNISMAHPRHLKIITLLPWHKLYQNIFLGLVKYFALSAITTVLLVCIPFELVSDFSPHKLEKQFFPPQQKHFEEAHSQNVQIFSANLYSPQNFEGHHDDCQNFLWFLKTKLQFTFNCECQIAPHLLAKLYNWNCWKVDFQ